MIDSINSNVKLGGCKAWGGFTLKIFGPSLPYSTNYYIFSFCPLLCLFTGLMLVLGFVFMMLVDQLSSGTGHSHSGGGSDGQPAVNITATLGLVVHAAADGVALGMLIFAKFCWVGPYQMMLIKILLPYFLHLSPPLISRLAPPPFSRNRELMTKL